MSLGSGKKNGRNETAERWDFHFVGRAEREGNGERGFQLAMDRRWKVWFFSGIR